MIAIQFDVFDLSFIFIIAMSRQVLQTEVGRATFYMHQTSGVCTGVCACYRTHQMEKTDTVHYLSN